MPAYNVKPARHLHAHVLVHELVFYSQLEQGSASRPRRRGGGAPRSVSIGLTAVMGFIGACGRMNLTWSSLWRRRQFSTTGAHPWPVSPRPWEKMTVAVCRAAAGTTRLAFLVADMVVNECAGAKKTGRGYVCWEAWVWGFGYGSCRTCGSCTGSRFIYHNFTCICSGWAGRHAGPVVSVLIETCTSWLQWYFMYSLAHISQIQFIRLYSSSLLFLEPASSPHSVLIAPGVHVIAILLARMLGHGVVVSKWFVKVCQLAGAGQQRTRPAADPQTQGQWT